MEKLLIMSTVNDAQTTPVKSSQFPKGLSRREINHPEKAVYPRLVDILPESRIHSQFFSGTPFH
jgi:hypothetical protein